MMERWSDRVFLVTGASAGIGAAVVRSLVGYGMKVVGCGRRVEKIQELAAELSGQPGQLFPIQCDVSKEEEILAMFDQIKTQHGGVDVCISNAGIGRDAPLLSGKTDHWRDMLNVNVLAPCICTREAWKSMKERNIDDGHIFLVNSYSGHRVLSNKSSHFYTATKFALSAILSGLRNEVREMKSHVRITAVSPGLVATELFQNMYPDDPEKCEAILSQKILEPKDIADTIIFALQMPPHVEINDILMRGTEQML